jgi:serine/threonine protein kinase
MSRTSPTQDPRAPDLRDLNNLAGIKLGNYRLERLVGRGRMGAVYLAQDEALLRPTAIKILSWTVAEARGQDPVQWFLSEARLVARINHPRVVQIYGAARQGSACYIAMEYVAGKSAEAMVAEHGAMAPETATDVLVQAASALQAAHGSGVVHRDVKPANLLIGAGGSTKLGDFGMALGSADLRTGNAHLRVGTPYYTAPEIWRGEMASPASDIYSLGASYFQLLTGRPPYPGHDVATVEQAHLRAAIPDLREISPKLPASCAALVKRALAKAPRERHASAQELLWEGRRVLQDLVSSAGAPERPKRPRAPAPIRDPRARPLPAPSGLLADVLGFVRRPFADVDAAACPYLEEPFASARNRLLEHVEEDATPVLALAGGPGSGRTVLCRRMAAEAGQSRFVVSVDLDRDSRGLTLVQQLCRAAGVVEDTSEEAGLDALVTRLGEERLKLGDLPLLILDGVTAQHPETPELAKVIAVGLLTRSFKLLLAGGTGLVEALVRSGIDFRGERVPEIPLPPLDRDQVSRYVRRWVEVALAPAAPPVIVSRDALLLVSLRSGGALARINCIAENMLLLAASERRRTLSSWHAWVASDRECWSERRAPAALPRRPAQWPPPEVVAVIDACRRGAGVPPWPRAASQEEPDGA